MQCFCIPENQSVSYKENLDEPSEDSKGMLGMLKIPVIWLMVFAVIVCAISLSFFDPTLAPHLASVRLSTIHKARPPFSVQPLHDDGRLDVPPLWRYLHANSATLGTAGRPLGLLQCVDAFRLNGDSLIHAARRTVAAFRH